ncbi:MAG: flagellar hook protein FlgE [Candidatus Magnetoovum sp. WYHC-5]|nr:flagellar hook protein FlgE [Candidatus Magnetoovum sp. WYHC-5]
MISALYTSLTGINYNSRVFQQSANNIANLNTVGYKGGSSQAGAFISTGNVLDLAINGNSYFVVEDANNNKVYTKNGEFTLDKDGYLVTPSGLKVQGYNADSSGVISSSLTDIQIDTGLTSPNKTQNVNISINLDAETETYTEGFSIENNKAQNYNYSTSIEAYDSLGGKHSVTAYFTKVDSNKWEVNYTTEADDGSEQLIQASSTQVLQFDENGELIAGATETISFDFANSSETPQEILFNYSAGLTEDGNTLSGTSQYASEFQLLGLNVDGNATGNMVNMQIGQDGVIKGTFTNGQTRVLGQVAVASFTNPSDLTGLGGNLYAQSQASGQALIGGANAASGAILSGTLETSNVSLASEFVNMMVSEYGITAGVKTIQATDEVMESLLSLKNNK